MKLIYIKSPLDIKDQNAIISLLKQSEGKAIAARVFRLENPEPVKSYLERRGIGYEAYQEWVELKNTHGKNLLLLTR